MATRDVVTLNETASRLEVAQAGDTYNLPRNTTVQGTLSATGAVTASKLGVGVNVPSATGRIKVDALEFSDGSTALTATAATGSQDLTSVLGIGNTADASTMRVGDVTIPALASTLAANAVDWVVYDTAKDSDGGKWRKRCQALSWYNEPLNTATRGATKEFPAKVLIVAEAAKVTIYDLTSPAVPMWMVFNQTSWGMKANVFGSSVSMNGGHLLIGDAVSGMTAVNFIGDSAMLYLAPNAYRLRNNIANRNVAAAGADIVGTGIVNSAVNSVAITVLDDAPIGSNGLPVPTIAVGTAGGLSVINNDGNVVNSVNSGVVQKVNFFGSSIYSGIDTGQRFRIYEDYSTGSFTDVAPVFSSLASNILGVSNASSVVTTADGGTAYKTNIVGVVLLRPNPLDTRASLVAIVANSYNTGYMVGDIRRCFLANSKTVDRSVKAATLTQVGTVTETVNAGGRNVYSGFSATNYFSEASHADWNALGTGDFSIIMSGVKWGTAGASNRNLISMGADVANSIMLQITNANQLTLYYYTTIWTAVAATSIVFTDTSEHVVSLYRSAGMVYIDVDGTTVASGAFTGSITTSGKLVLGNSEGNTVRFWAGGQCSSVRISATAPTAEQSKYIAEQENKLNGGALCLLSADAVTDLSYNADADILGVETAGAYDYLNGLEVIQRGIVKTDTTDLGFERVQVNGTTDVRVASPAVSVREQLAKNAATDSKQPVVKAIAAVGGVVSLPQGFKATGCYDVTGAVLVRLTSANKAFDGFINSITGLTGTQTYDVTMERV